MYTRLNNIYRQMKARCYNAKRKDYKRYGGRGILVCSEWLNTETVKGVKGRSSKGWLAFRDWALSHGYKDNLTLDRIDNNKGYSPDNCRWCKASVNNHNRRNTAKIDGIPLTNFAEIHNLTYSHIHYIYYRLINGNIIPNTENVLKYANQLPINNENC